MRRTIPYLIGVALLLLTAGCQDGVPSGDAGRAEDAPVARSAGANGAQPAAAQPMVARPPGNQQARELVGCGAGQTPLGALPPALATWCEPATAGDPTFVSSTNSWLDDFNHGLSNAEIGPGYLVWDTPPHPDSYYRAAHFRHNNHWMVDIAPYQPSGRKPPYGGGHVFLRPDRSFTFEGGVLSVEADVAAGIEEYIDDAWPEIVIATAPAPTHSIDDLYAYGQFGGAWAFGCRLDPERYPICDLKNPMPNTRENDHASQTYQISPTNRPPGAMVTGGHPQRAWRSCAGTDPDQNCRDRFRLELSRTTFRLWVNGTLYFTASGLPPLPEEMLNGPVYVYFAESLSSGIDARVVRFHWDRIAVNVAAGP